MSCTFKVGYALKNGGSQLRSFCLTYSRNAVELFFTGTGDILYVRQEQIEYTADFIDEGKNICIEIVVETCYDG